jgi:hypothetical protein
VEVMRETKGKPFKEAMRFLITLCHRAGMSKGGMRKWFPDLGKGTRLSRLRGWVLWDKFRLERNMTAEAGANCHRPDVSYAEFIGWMDDNGVQNHLRKDVFPAVQALLHMAGLGARIAESEVAKTVRKNTSEQVRSVPKDTKILWNSCSDIHGIRALPFVRDDPHCHVQGQSPTRRQSHSGTRSEED